ncbi:MAG: GGDEF domain-containing protein [Proteobacteria bacterium]|nr:GGDEF domain-containing protein [Pseudomonadota bacterium]MBU1419878.1 GGDEF domain-containing protein [Pseudomonadota bacterium]MBU1455777.1 GGDEF domain-containing protein [Pseudomonadota bacterium]
MPIKQNDPSDGQRPAAFRQHQNEDESILQAAEEMLSSTMPRKLTNQVREFFSACLRLHSYNIFKNPYIWFGILWGLPVPLVTIFLTMAFTANNHLDHAITHVLQNPLQWFFLAHPLLFGALFGILGTIRQEKDTQIQNLVEKLRQLSTQDPLTGLVNRRYFIEAFAEEVARTLRQNIPLSVVFLDLDFFKNINDTHGHRMGDTVLKEISHYVQRQCRPFDTIARWGGEEFIILLPANDEKEAVACAERIRRGIAAGVSKKIPFPVTISAGVARYEAGDSLQTLTDRADQALYKAKQSGRNKVVIWQEQEPINT